MTSEIEFATIIRSLGRASMTVTLPKATAEKAGLKRGDPVVVIVRRLGEE